MNGFGKEMSSIIPRRSPFDARTPAPNRTQDEMTGSKGKVSVARHPKVAFRLAMSEKPAGSSLRHAGARLAAMGPAAAIAICMGFGLAMAVLTPGSARASEITERIAVDNSSGIAIFGYDPVGYFIEKRPVPGRPGYEWVWRDAVWRFASLANLDEFKRAPESFAPAYGGYDADAVTRGAASFPDPTIFAIIDSRLFLFRSGDAMERFLDGDGVAAADRAWPTLSASLRP
jgi:hypothetical protein